MSIICYCGYEIHEKYSWKYCKKCGTSTSRLVVDVEGGDIALSVNHKKSIAVTLRNIGFHGLFCECKVFDNLPWVEITSQSSFEIEPGNAKEVILEAALPNDSLVVSDIKMDVRSSDARRSKTDIWRRDNFRNQTIKIPVIIEADVKGPAVKVFEEILVFSSDTRKRKLRIENLIADNVTLSWENPIRDIQIQSPGPWILEKELVLTVNVDERALYHGLESDTLQLRDSFGNIYQIQIYIVREKVIGKVANAIVGIDFGTQNTSVFARLPTENNRIESIPILFNDESELGENYPIRVPSLIAYFSDNSEPIFGLKARDLLIRDEDLRTEISIKSTIKESVQSANELEKDDNDKVLVDILKKIREDISLFFKKKYDYNSLENMKFVVTLPPLDSYERYSLQKETMKEAYNKVFEDMVAFDQVSLENDFIFAKEPEAAAACFLFDEESFVPIGLRGYAIGDLIVVVDSGAGTTDIAIVEVIEGTTAGGKYGLKTHNVLGTMLQKTNQANENDSGTLQDLHPDQENSEKVLQKLRFAGQVVDDLVWKIMLVNAAKAYEEYDIQKTPEDIETALFDIFASLETDPLQVKSFLSEMVKRDLVKAINNNDPNPKSSLGDLLSSPEIHGFIERLDSEAGQGNFNALLSMCTITANDLNVEVQPYIGDILQAVIGSVNEILQENKDLSLKYVFLVGGNSNLPMLYNRFKTEFGDRVKPNIFDTMDVELLGKIRNLQMTAVSRGSVWFYKAPLSNTVPFKVLYELHYDGKKYPPKTIFAENSISSNMFLPNESYMFRNGGIGNIYISFEINRKKYLAKDFQLLGYNKGFHQISLDIDDNWNLQAYIKPPENSNKSLLFSHKLL